MKQWRTLSKEVILTCNRFLTVENHVVELHDGKIIRDWPWVITPDYVNVVALTDDRKFICFRQTKYAIQGTSLAPVGGYTEPGEIPLHAAQRELLEETGYEAGEWTDLGQYPVDANRGAGKGSFFLARGAHKTSAPKTDDLEEQELLLLSQEEIETALQAGEFKVLPWAAAVLLALQHLRRPG
jgi:ADP-ribose pyrophosphatase